MVVESFSQRARGLLIDAPEQREGWVSQSESRMMNWQSWEGNSEENPTFARVELVHNLFYLAASRHVRRCLVPLAIIT
jgi:hypothetical protein